MENIVWVRIRSDGTHAILEVQYDNGEYVELARELLGTPFSHKSRVWPVADRRTVPDFAEYIL